MATTADRFEVLATLTTADLEDVLQVSTSTWSNKDQLVYLHTRTAGAEPLTPYDDDLDFWGGVALSREQARELADLLIAASTD